MRARQFARRLMSTTGFAIAALHPVAVLASQGPGAGPGTASPAVQVAMAVIVHGGSALVIAAGGIGALRKAASPAASSSSPAA